MAKVQHRLQCQDQEQCHQGLVQWSALKDCIGIGATAGVRDGYHPSARERYLLLLSWLRPLRR
eukprot:15460565-Alexandrium_andersonii.AAC.1